jgi:predicted helicase
MKNSDSSNGKARIYYARVDEFWRKGEKYAYLEEKQHVGNVEWQELQPDAKHNWLTEGMKDEFEDFIPTGSKESKAKGNRKTIFKIYGRGVSTSRDAWTYNFDYIALVENINRTIDTYNEHIFRLTNSKDMQSLDDFVVNDDKRISWSLGLKNHLLSQTR